MARFKGMNWPGLETDRVRCDPAEGEITVRSSLEILKEVHRRRLSEGVLDSTVETVLNGVLANVASIWGNGLMLDYHGLVPNRPHHWFSLAESVNTSI